MKTKEIIEKYEEYTNTLQGVLNGEHSIDDGIILFQKYVKFMNKNWESKV